MGHKRDYYDILGLPRGASEEEIRKAYRRLARQYHPDVNREESANERFKEINEAYEVLSDPEKRRKYDQFGHVGLGGFGDLGGFETFGFGDIFETFFGGFASATARRGVQRGADLRYDLTLTFEEAVFGCEKELAIPRWERCPACGGMGVEQGTQPVRCPNCDGTGEIRRARQTIFGQFISVTVCDRCQGEGKIIVTPCATCHGTSRVQTVRHIRVKIPAGVDDGTQIKLSGEGEAGIKGGPPGSLYVVLRVQEHSLFKRIGNDIIYELPLNIVQAALGDEVNVPTVDGVEAKIRIPAGTQNGRVFRLKEKGIPYARGGGRGDQQIKVKIVIPTELTQKQKEILLELSQTFGTPVTPQDGKGFFHKVKDVFAPD
ncbi:MAG: molecular chaperone DnaJ [Chloroflexi bacterium]|nr:molecular chaperone DnaJ [Chloroflexota bacterium]MCL5074371.1 molecular chaperone DnaJ [Chloroflexota bacterium]